MDKGVYTSLRHLEPVKIRAMEEVWIQGGVCPAYVRPCRKTDQ